MQRFALLLAETRLQQEFIRWLSIIGAFFVGFALSHLLLRMLCSFAFKKQMPSKLMQLFRVCGGLGAAILVYFLLMPSGGSGPGGSGGADLYGGKAPEDQPQPKDKAEAPKKEKPKEITPPKKDILPSADELITVTVLPPSAERKGRLYLYENDNEPQTEQEILDRIKARDKPNQKRISAVRIVVTGNGSKPAFQSLEASVKALDKTVLSPPEMKIPN